MSTAARLGARALQSRHGVVERAEEIRAVASAMPIELSPKRLPPGARLLDDNEYLIYKDNYP